MSQSLNAIAGRVGCASNLFRITNPSGEPNQVGYWPWMVSLGFEDGPNWRHQCGGSLLTAAYVITAVHCLTQGNQRLKVRAGDRNLLSTVGEEVVQVRNIGEMIPHPKYDGSAYYDIAMVKLERRFNLNSHVRPVCVPKNGSEDVDLRRGQSVTLTGWGAMSLNNLKATPELQVIPMKIFSKRYCDQSYRRGNRKTELVPNLFTRTVLCAGYEVGDYGSCAGDSGGPIVTFDDRSFTPYYVQVGVVVGGADGCGRTGAPGVYVRLDDQEILDFVRKTSDLEEIYKNAPRRTTRRPPGLDAARRRLKN